MHADIQSILIDRDSIAERIEVLAGQMEKDLRSRAGGGQLLLLPIMTGSVVFVADLMRHLPIPFRIEPVRARSYVGATTVATQPVTVEGLDWSSLEGNHVVIVDDVLDSGKTLESLRRMAEEAGAASVMACVLLRKETRRMFLVNTSASTYRTSSSSVTASTTTGCIETCPISGFCVRRSITVDWMFP